MGCRSMVVNKIINLVTRVSMVCQVVMGRWLADTTEGICRINITSIQATQTQFSMVTLRIHRECRINNNKDPWAATEVQALLPQWDLGPIINHLILCINKALFPKDQLPRWTDLSILETQYSQDVRCPISNSKIWVHRSAAMTHTM